jgi:hypothetical protein
MDTKTKRQIQVVLGAVEQATGRSREDVLQAIVEEGDALPEWVQVWVRVLRSKMEESIGEFVSPGGQVHQCQSCGRLHGTASDFKIYVERNLPIDEVDYAVCECEAECYPPKSFREADRIDSSISSPSV